MSEKKIECFKLEDMTRGWFIGDFEPCALKTPAVEVGVKHYKAGDSEKAHYHKAAKEFTVIVKGEVEMNGERFKEGDIIFVPQSVPTDFKAITNVITTVVKLPGAKDDKFLVE